ncbi:Helix-turn-helix domain protein [compost metagenome]
MKATAFGKYLRGLRLENEILLKDMADVLNVSSAYLSSLELGKKSVPDSFVTKIVDEYGLNSNEAADLRHAATLSQPSVKIDLVGKQNDDREIVMSFARRYESLSEESKKQLKKLLEV